MDAYPRSAHENGQPMNRCQSQSVSGKVERSVGNERNPGIAIEPARRELQQAMNYRLIATQVGDILKWSSSVKEIGRIASALFRFRCERFPNESISSSRAQLIYDWILSLAKEEMPAEARDRLLAEFCRKIASEVTLPQVYKVLADNGVPASLLNREHFDLFFTRNFHPEIQKHSRELFLQGNYFHAVFEAAKAYNKLVRDKAQSTRDGQALMLEVWGWEKGVLKVTPCQTDTDKNVQDGIKFLSAGLMQAIRNPTAHEPAVDWPISRNDCLDILSFISFLFRQLDQAVYFKA